MTPTLDLMRAAWNRLSPLPGGKRLFDKLLGRVVPYTGSIDPHVEEMRAGYARVYLDDRRAVRNHLRSVHAIALVNLAELVANLALIGGLPKGGRMIITGISIDYLKKARGRITAECQVEVPQTLERREYPIPVSLRDGKGVEVARATVRSLIDAAPA
jgi:acyl-coenzyme A thioesterase PaaI-like protein